MCDGCDRTDLPLRWWGEHVRLCAVCIDQREREGRKPIPLKPGQVSVRGIYPDGEDRS